MDQLTLEVVKRDPRARSGDIPAVIYGHGFESRPISVARNVFNKLYQSAGMSRLVDVKVDGEAPVKALIKEIQRHPLTMEPIHVDFHQVRMDEKMTVEVPLKFVGESEAVKALGGTLVKSRDDVKVVCLPADLPSVIEVDISKLATFDDMITVGDLAVAAVVKILDDARTTVANVMPPLTAEELAKLESSQLGDVTTVKTEAELKKAEEEAKAAEEGAPEAEAKAAPEAKKE
jgi:large subunit ribosomal protein L25